MSDRLAEWVDEAKASAAAIEHPWDARALDWPLTAESVVVEVGGYKGRWALQIAARYQPRLFVFEPQPWAYDVCKAALGDSATVLNYGLGDQDRVATMSKWETDGGTLMLTTDTTNQVRLREISTIFKQLEITHIDLLLMNIEGYEHTLLPHMLDQGIYPDRLMVQMHDFAGDSAVMRARLARIYRLLWDYGDVLTAWERA